MLEHHGEAYRDGLQPLGAQLGVAHAVDYRGHLPRPGGAGPADPLGRRRLLPYDSREQVTSGVLIEAVAAGVPVVATAFPHAVELLTGGPGLVVPHRDPAALATAIRRVLTEPGLAARLAGRVRPLAADLRWPAVAPATAPSPKAPGRPLARRQPACRRDGDHRTPPDRDGVSAGSTAPAPSFAHLARLSDDTGLFEHARHAIVRREHGYCVDDVARGLVVVCREPEPSDELLRLAERYLAFLTHAQDTDGAFHNRLGHDRRWADEPGLGDWWGGRCGAWAPPSPAARPPWIRERGAGRRSAAVPPGAPRAPRAMAFAGLGAAEVLPPSPGPRRPRAALLADAASTDRPGRVRPAVAVATSSG